jgi:hypothetical protein
MLRFATVEAIGYHRSKQWVSTKFAIVRFATDENRDETLRRLNYVDLYGCPLIFAACDEATIRIRNSKQGIVYVSNSLMSYRQLYELCRRFGRVITIWRTKNGDSYVQFYEEADADRAVHSLKDGGFVRCFTSPWQMDDCDGEDKCEGERLAEEGEYDEIEVDGEDYYVFRNHRKGKDKRIRRHRRRESRGRGRRMARGMAMARQEKHDIVTIDDVGWDWRHSDYDDWSEWWPTPPNSDYEDSD